MCIQNMWYLASVTCSKYLMGVMLFFDMLSKVRISEEPPYKRSFVTLQGWLGSAMSWLLMLLHALWPVAVIFFSKLAHTKKHLYNKKEMKQA